MAAAPHELPADAVHGAEAAAHGADGAHAAVFPPFDLSLFGTQLIWFALTFGVLYFLMANVALPKVGAVLEKRAASLKGDLDAAARESAAAEEARLAMERNAAEARAQARKLIDDMRAKAQAELAAEQEKAETALAAKAAEADARIAQMRTAALAQVGAIAKELSGDIVARLAPGARA